MGAAEDLLATIASLARDQQSDGILTGTVIGGTWNPQTATMQVVMGDTAAVADLPDSDDEPDIREVTVAPGQFGGQFGPRGGERVTLSKSSGGWIAHFEHADNDTPQAPAGEVWQVHWNDIPPPEKNGQIDSFWKLTNDGVKPGDGRGGAIFGGTGDYVALTCGNSNGVITVSACSSQGLLTVTGPNGDLAVIDFNAMKVSLGGDTTATNDGVVRKSDLQAALDDIHTKLATWAAANLMGGSGAGPPGAFATAEASQHVFSEE